jgi:hypothetical protein
MLLKINPTMSGGAVRENDGGVKTGGVEIAVVEQSSSAAVNDVKRRPLGTRIPCSQGIGASFKNMPFRRRHRFALGQLMQNSCYLTRTFWRQGLANRDKHPADDHVKIHLIKPHESERVPPFSDILQGESRKFPISQKLFLAADLISHLGGHAMPEFRHISGTATHISGQIDLAIASAAV